VQVGERDTDDAVRSACVQALLRRRRVRVARACRKRDDERGESARST
jgi:hypothetical protein